MAPKRLRKGEAEIEKVPVGVCEQHHREVPAPVTCVPSAEFDGDHEPTIPMRYGVQL